MKRVADELDRDSKRQKLGTDSTAIFKDKTQERTSTDLLKGIPDDSGYISGRISMKWPPLPTYRIQITFSSHDMGPKQCEVVFSGSCVPEFQRKGLEFKMGQELHISLQGVVTEPVPGRGLGLPMRLRYSEGAALEILPQGQAPGSKIDTWCQPYPVEEPSEPLSAGMAHAKPTTQVSVVQLMEGSPRPIFPPPKKSLHMPLIPRKKPMEPPVPPTASPLTDIGNTVPVAPSYLPAQYPAITSSRPAPDLLSRFTSKENLPRNPAIAARAPVMKNRNHAVGLKPSDRVSTAWVAAANVEHTSRPGCVLDPGERHSQPVHRADTVLTIKPSSADSSSVLPTALAEPAISTLLLATAPTREPQLPSLRCTEVQADPHPNSLSRPIGQLDVERQKQDLIVRRKQREQNLKVIPPLSVKVPRKHPDCVPIKQVLATTEWPRTFTVRARVVDFFPFRIEDSFVRMCTKCNEIIPNTDLPCLGCNDADMQRVKIVCILRLAVVDEEDETLHLSVSGDISLLDCMPRGALLDDPGPVRQFSQRMRQLLGNLETIHDGILKDEVIQPTGPETTLTIDSWKGSDRIFYGLREYQS
ncbi:hypothetical protein DFH06DRAFT_1467469 [Mycena polygramma]|nr:hypothetical protein DFH06DRAFT_1467469 [Mycena polygramma]